MMETNTDSRHELMKKMQEADFFLIDLQLYLNTHPRCQKALAMYAEAVRDAKKIRKEYEEKYGPITATSTPATVPWQWSKNPWTWEKERS